MIKVKLAGGDLAKMRFSCSPLVEIQLSIAALRQPGCRRAMHEPWFQRARSRLARANLAHMMAVLPDGWYIPDFVTPPPAVGIPDLGAELQSLCATPPDQVRRELDLAYRGRPMPSATRALRKAPAAGLEAIADQFSTYFNLVLADCWPEMCSILDAELMEQARRLVSGGCDPVLQALHADIRLEGDWLRINTCHESVSAESRGNGLILLPSVFAWPRGLVTLQAAWPVMVVYPPRSVPPLWGESGGRRRVALAALLGPTRAAMLERLERPLSTTDLAGQLKISMSCASYHLAVLRDAGLLRARRQGRRVLYRRTPAAETLLTAGG